MRRRNAETSSLPGQQRLSGDPTIRVVSCCTAVRNFFGAGVRRLRRGVPGPSTRRYHQAPICTVLWLRANGYERRASGAVRDTPRRPVSRRPTAEPRTSSASSSIGHSQCVVNDSSTPSASPSSSSPDPISTQATTRGYGWSTHSRTDRGVPRTTRRSAASGRRSLQVLGPARCR